MSFRYVLMRCITSSAILVVARTCCRIEAAQIEIISLKVSWNVQGACVTRFFLSIASPQPVDEGDRYWCLHKGGHGSPSSFHISLAGGYTQNLQTSLWWESRPWQNQVNVDVELNGRLAGEGVVWTDYTTCGDGSIHCGSYERLLEVLLAGVW